MESSPRRVQIMGVLNVTPDSFSDGGSYGSVQEAVDAGRRMVDDGADIIDVGGESTRPGATPVSETEEIRRVVPVVKKLSELGIRVSIDTQKAAVAKAAIEVGAAMVNDVSALRDGAMSTVCADSGVEVVLMHMLGTPETMQTAPAYEDVVAEVRSYLAERAAFAEANGIARNRIWIDPGIGFGKTREHNLELIRGTDQLSADAYPVLVGASRKRFLGELIGETDPRFRVEATLAVHLEAVRRGAAMVRVHDVAAHRRALAVHSALIG